MKSTRYAIIWQKKNKWRTQALKEAWYYKNRMKINLSLSKGDGQMYEETNNQS